MDNETKYSPAGAPVRSCESDHECTLLTCDFCLKELPPNNGIREEGKDYVAHFCGLDCLDAWRNRHTHDKRLDREK